MMDATFSSVLRLWEQELSRKEIARRLNISFQKVTKILVTAGALETPESKLYAQGYNLAQIAAALGETERAAFPRVPYAKGMYGAEYPSINALRIRKCREGKTTD